jgi:hypothetical protein
MAADWPTVRQEQDGGASAVPSAAGVSRAWDGGDDADSG